MTQPVTLEDLSLQLNVIAKAVLSNKSTLNIAEAAVYTSMAESYLYKLTSKQQIPHYKPRGKLVYFDRAELDAWLRQNRVSTTAEIEQKSANHMINTKGG